MASQGSLPALSDLPLKAGDPPNSAWGLWGDKAALGALNRLTDEVVLNAVKNEIKTGERVGLEYATNIPPYFLLTLVKHVADTVCSLPLDLFDPPLLGRAGFSQKVINKDPLVVNDDVITFNTQGSSQWDSFRHFAYQKDKKFYNGITQADIHAQARTAPNGLQAWSERCIAGRGVLVDYASWAARQGRAVQYFQKHPITVDDVKAIVAEEGLTIQPGDILFLRTGYAAAYQLLSRDERAEVAGVREWIGLGQGRATTEWLWDNQFAAVASDSPGFECRPPVDPAWHLHPILLAGWGTPIGELFDLDKLAALCSKHKRWSFFVTSAPLNYEGAVASPPNAVAIF
ncbi:hypothetical protein SPI_00829 [Niveomyces insectorum RCEF 264]|uniref:Cyclase n=1 Tax=Niveomyces insectorum RCEF 264 TaxID=1081102 RepID=A0A162LCH0_9HYPO|nr:hypothetical protein SPI_00829 [Niveomyces insectorum RCEF 264]